MERRFGGFVARHFDSGRDDATITEHPKGDRLGTGLGKSEVFR